MNGKPVETEIEHFDLQFYEPDGFQAPLESESFVETRRFKAHEFVAPGEKDETIVFECTRP